MEISYEEAQLLLKKRFSEYPEIKTLVESREFKETLANIVTFEKVSAWLLPTIENEVLVILAFYAPFSHLAKNISESTGLSLEVSENLATLIDSLLLSDIRNDLEAYEYLLNAELAKTGTLPEAPKDLREKLELRPVGQPSIGTSSNTEGPRPLTREEVLQSLSLRRTMATDIESILHNSNTAQTQNSKTSSSAVASNP